MSRYSIKELVYYFFHRLPSIIKGKYLYHNLVKVHWGRGLNNFGDCLSPDILKHYGLTPVYVPNQMDADIILAGSILQWVNPKYKGIIIGTGGDDVQYSFNSASVLAVRGKLTHNNFRTHKDYKSVVYGDPGLLMSYIYPNIVEKKYDLGIVPHFVDWNTDCINKLRKQFNNNPNVVFISPIGTPKEVIRQIKECRHIISSSLHGLIIADAFHIPNIRFVNRDTMPTYFYDYKFDDYYSSLNMDSECIDIHTIQEVDILSSLINITTLKDVDKIESLKKSLNELMIHVSNTFKK